MRAPPRALILHLVRSSPEARKGLDALPEGEMGFEQTMMETGKQVSQANQEVKRQMNYARSPTEF